MTTKQTYPAWTRDGTRPWHHRTHDRALADGRTVRVWLGAAWMAQSPGEFTAFMRMRKNERLAMGYPLNYWPGRGERHVGACALEGYIGIAYLPADPRPATAAWPGWRHLAHATRDWTDLLPEYERIAALPDDELVTLLEG